MSEKPKHTIARENPRVIGLRHLNASYIQHLDPESSVELLSKSEASLKCPKVYRFSSNVQPCTKKLAFSLQRTT